MITFLLLAAISCACAADGRVSGRVTDAQEKPAGATRLRLRAVSGGPAIEAVADADGRFCFAAVPTGAYEIAATAAGFDPTARAITVGDSEALTIDLRFSTLAALSDSVTVSADGKEIDIEAPDPAIKVYAAADLLDASPGRPGVPVSIPGYPAETASGGIKAPQYFAPGVAGDHGEPVAQYLQVGGYLLPNNLSANAHGNGYADPNFLIAGAIDAVEVDGGAFNVREGNHALNLTTSYSLRTHLDPFFTLAGDRRDITATGGFNPGARSWVAVEVAYGNGFLDRLEHRKQVKLNGGQVFRKGNHIVTLFGAGYYGFSYLAGLSPIFGFDAADTAAGWKQYPDTIDPRQKDQTHNALVAGNDRWAPVENQELQFSGFFRTYNLSLFSDFGSGLIRQSEFRTVAGAGAAYRRRFSKHLTLLAGADYLRDAPRRDDLDYYNFFDPAMPANYGPFVKVDANNLTLSPVGSYIAVEGGFARYFHYYAGWRRDEIFLDNQNLLAPSRSWSTLAGVNSPKATLSFVPRENSWAPEVAVSFGKSFFTEDPRIGAAAPSPEAFSPVETARSWQLVAIKRFRHTEFKATLGHETQSAEYGKIDADTGLQSNLGPGRIRYLALSLRQDFRFGWLQATFEQADARDLASGQVTPEAPRLIGDFSWTYERLPFHLRAKGEFEYLGQRIVGDRCASYCLGVPDREFRLAVARPFLNGRVNAGVNLVAARGYTGQTVENFAAAVNPVGEVVGVRMPSYFSLDVTYRFGR